MWIRLPDAARAEQLVGAVPYRVAGGDLWPAIVQNTTTLRVSSRVEFRQAISAGAVHPFRRRPAGRGDFADFKRLRNQWAVCRVGVEIAAEGGRRVGKNALKKVKFWLGRPEIFAKNLRFCQVGRKKSAKFIRFYQVSRKKPAKLSGFVRSAK
jgi:hypothetical protein